MYAVLVQKKYSHWHSVILAVSQFDALLNYFLFSLGLIKGKNCPKIVKKILQIVRFLQL